MSSNSRVVWSEGMFLRPQHFQQQDRYIENNIFEQVEAIRPHFWGFKELAIDHQQLSLGKLVVTSARGIFPDGTPFNFPQNDDPPVALELPTDLKNTVVSLCLPIRRAGLQEVNFSDEAENLTRIQSVEVDQADSASEQRNSATIEIGKLKLALFAENGHLDQYMRLGLVRVSEVRSDRQVVIDDTYIPPVLDCQAATRLSEFVVELKGLLQHRGDALAGRVTEAGRGGAADISDFLLLQVVNRYEPLIKHLTEKYHFHPESLFELCVSLAGELSTFTSSTKRPPQFVSYDHAALDVTYKPVMGALRQSLSSVLEQRATSMPLQQRKYGIHVSPINDRSILNQAVFVLAVHASMPVEELRKRFPSQVKIGPTEKIRDLVNVQLPGIQVRPLPVAPRQIPYHSGYVYFELDKHNEYWQMMATSGGFAFHIGGEFPGLEIEFWAIRE